MDDVNQKVDTYKKTFTIKLAKYNIQCIYKISSKSRNDQNKDCWV